MCEAAIASNFKNNLNLEKDYNYYKKLITEIIEKDIENFDALNSLSNETQKFLQKNLEVIDNLLKNLRICDPAVGSGAFPVSMMNIVVKLRRTLKLMKKDREDGLNYRLKLHFIKKNIYGVDIDKSAVEIAKLRPASIGVMLSLSSCPHKGKLASIRKVSRAPRPASVTWPVARQASQKLTATLAGSEISNPSSPV